MVPRDADSECSSGGRVSGVAIRAVNSSATAPIAHRAHFNVLKNPRSSHFDMTFLPGLYLTENSVSQSNDARKR